MKHLNGIQQVGFGCENLYETWQWYIDNFGVNIRILEDDTVAERMLPYTGGVPQKRHACIAMNLQGGCGCEIWQYSDRKPQKCAFIPQPGDLGIFAAKFRSNDVAAFHAELSAKYDKVSPLMKAPDGKPTFIVTDPWDKMLQIVQDDYRFLNMGRKNGGVCGASIGVTDIERSLKLYSDIIGFDKVIYDQIGTFEDLSEGKERYRRVLLTTSVPFCGPFSEVYGPGYIELVQALDREPKKIYEGRFWGDPGFIQICFDVKDMGELAKYLAPAGYKFTVDSCPDGEIFDMGEASGHFTYIEDPDGTLIEFVQTHKVPLIKKIYLDLDKRSKDTPFPKILFRIMALTKIKKLQ